LVFIKTRRSSLCLPGEAAEREAHYTHFLELRKLFAKIFKSFLQALTGNPAT